MQGLTDRIEVAYYYLLPLTYLLVGVNEQCVTSDYEKDCQ